jgi:hypothetical protein
MLTLTGPANGRWVRVTSTQRRVYLRCAMCDALVTEGWAYYVGIVAHAQVCVTCADSSIDNDREVTMSGTAGITPQHLTEIALALEASNLDWEEGRATSPDTRDFVLITERILTDRIGPEYLWLSDATHESVAEAMYQMQCDGLLSQWSDMAEWLAEAITVGTEERDPATMTDREMFGHD